MKIDYIILSTILSDIKYSMNIKLNAENEYINMSKKIGLVSEYYLSQSYENRIGEVKINF